MVEMSEAVAAEHLELKQFLREKLYRHYRVQRMTSKARRVVQELFEVFMEDVHCCPTSTRARAPLRKRAAARRPRPRRCRLRRRHDGSLRDT